MDSDDPFEADDTLLQDGELIDMAAEQTKKDIKVLGEPEYARRKKAIAQIVSENPMAAKYMEVVPPSSDKEVSEWMKTPEGQKISRKIDELVGEYTSLNGLYYDKGQQRVLENALAEKNK